MGLGLATAWVGYWLGYFGWCSVRGPGVGLLDLAVPGRTVVIPGSSVLSKPPGVNPVTGPGFGVPGSAGYNPQNPANLPSLPGYNPLLPSLA